MASKKKQIEPDDIDLLGKKPAARMLSQFAQQAGADAVPVLERAFRSGSVDVRDAAARALADLDAALLEGLAREAIAALGKKPPKKELRALLKCLALSGAPDALATLAERARTEDVSAALPPTLLLRVWRVVAPQLAGLDADTAMAWLAGLGLPKGAVDAPPDDATLILSAIVDHNPLPGWQKAEAAQALHALGAQHLPAYAAMGARIDVEGVPSSFAIDALLKSDPAHAYEVLAPRFRRDPAARATIARLLDAHADARWLDEAQALMGTDLRAASSALVRIGSERARALLLARADGSRVLDDATREILHALGAAGEPRVAPLLLRWLEDAQGEVVAPMLLAALGASAHVADIPRIERVAARQPARAAFFAQCIAAIEARAS